MPKIFEYKGYTIYFWVNENNEPIHVHVSKGSPTKNSTKIWLTSRGGTFIAHNKGRIPVHDLRSIETLIVNNYIRIQGMWLNCFGSISFYC